MNSRRELSSPASSRSTPEGGSAPAGCKGEIPSGDAVPGWDIVPEGKTRTGLTKKDSAFSESSNRGAGN
jgi:hypothetical protein